MIYKEGEVWVTKSRKGRLTIKLLKNLNTEKDEWFDAEIVEGTAKYISVAYDIEQKLTGMGTPGTIITCRTSLTQFIKELT